MGNCIQCRYADFLDDQLSCWRNAPRAHVVPCADCGEPHIYAVQPTVQPDWLCGEYHPANIKKMEQTRRTWEAIQREIEQHYQEYLREREDGDQHDSNVVTLRNIKPKGTA